MIEKLKEIDYFLFSAINGFHSPIIDKVSVFISSKYFVLFLLIPFLLSLKLKEKWIYVLFFSALSIGFVDFTNYHFFKPFFARSRPCYNLKLINTIHSVVECGGKFGFMSSHAANSFAFCGLFQIICRPTRKFILFSFVWGLLVCFSRVQLGLHFPADVFFGAIYGFSISLTFIYLHNKFLFQL